MRPRALLAVIICAGFALRVACIGSGLPGKSRSLTTYHPDESITLYSIAAMEPEKLNFHPGESFFWGSLYTYAVAGALKAASAAGYVKERGRDFFEENPGEADRLFLAGRAVSAAAGTLTIAFVFMAGKELFGAPAGLMAAFMTAVSAGAVMCSVYLKPEPLMLMFCSLSLYWSARILKKNGGRACLWAGLAAGLAAAAKYNGGVFLIVPVFAALLAGDRRLWQVPLSFLAGFIAGCPYSLLDARAFYNNIHSIAGMGTQAPPPWNLGLHEGLSGYLSYYLPYAFGWPLAALLLLSFAWPFAAGLLNKKGKRSLWPDRTAVFLLVPAAALFALFASSHRQMVLYGVPLWPLLFLLAAKACAELFSAAPGRAAKMAVAAAGCLVGAHALFYSASYVSLFSGPNVREEASAWIEANIPADKKIGVTKKYFWTPPALRNLGPGYRVLSFRDDSFNLREGALSLKATAAKADYLVLSDFEIRDFLRLPAVYPEEYKALKSVLGAGFSLEARFEHAPSFLGVKFSKRHPPWDWMYPNPTIYVYRKKAPGGAGGRG